jgi:diguanylate cyclase (GGDEF)-like protein
LSAPDPFVVAAEQERRSGRQRPAPAWAYVVVSVPLASVAYLLIQLVYLWEQQRAGLLERMPSLAEIAVGTLTVHGASFAGWLALAGAASAGACRIAVVLYESQQRMIEARDAQALRDPLTGLHNRRAMSDRLQLLHALAERSGRPYAVISLDADSLKRVNDTLGHDAGDDALRDIADTLRASARAVDDCIRLGGDEFVVLCPDTELAAGAVVAERFLAALQARHASDPAGRLGVSIGITAWRKGINARDVLKRADALLYEAKRMGKGRVVVDPEQALPAPAG